MAVQDEVIDDDRCETARRTLAMRIAQRNRLRAERLARLRPAQTGSRPPAAAAPDPAAGLDMTAPPGSALEEFLRALTRAPDRPAACGAPPAVARAATPGPETPAAAAADTAAAPGPVSDPVAEFAAEFAAEMGLDPDSVLGTARGFEPAPAAVLPFERPAAAAEARPGAGPDTAHAPACNLVRLDGAGPGLIWALRRAGIASLADVAALEPDGLAARLGPLGRLVPARAWIDTARAAITAGSPSSS